MNLAAGASAATGRVLVFDSGVGGLSICGEIIATSPALTLHYLSDNAAFPYGEKTPRELLQRVAQLLQQAIETLQPDLLVIACNTASTVVLPKLREQLSIPVVGVVPAIKTAAELSRSKTIALLATPGTATRHYTTQLIAEHAAEQQVIRVGSSQLVRAIERHLHGEALCQQTVEDVISQIEQQPGSELIDTVVLGCTHFPLITATLRELRPHWQWLDSGAAIARRVDNLLAQSRNNRVSHNSRSESGDEKPVKNIAWFTQKRPELRQLEQFLASLNFAPAREFELS